MPPTSGIARRRQRAPHDSCEVSDIVPAREGVIPSSDEASCARAETAQGVPNGRAPVEVTESPTGGLCVWRRTRSRGGVTYIPSERLSCPRTIFGGMSALRTISPAPLSGCRKFRERTRISRSHPPTGEPAAVLPGECLRAAIRLPGASVGLPRFPSQRPAVAKLLLPQTRAGHRTGRRTRETLAPDRAVRGDYRLATPAGRAAAVVSKIFRTFCFGSGLGRPLSC